MRKIALISLIALLLPMGVFAQNQQPVEQALQRAALKATSTAKQVVKRCIWCNRMETAENQSKRCPADQDVSCYFVQDKTTSVRTQNEPDEMAKKAPQDKPMKPVSADFFGKNVRVCAFCGRVETPENKEDRCPADPDVYCLFYEVQQEQTEKPLTTAELENAKLLTYALKTLDLAEKNVSAKDIALAVRATKKQVQFEYGDPQLEILTETVLSYIQNSIKPTEHTTTPYSYEEILSLLVFLSNMGK